MLGLLRFFNFYCDSCCVVFFDFSPGCCVQRRVRGEIEKHLGLETCSMGLYPDANKHGFPLGASLLPQISTKKQWVVGFQSPARPREIMTQIFGALQGLNVKWKKTGHYNMRCLFIHGIQDPKSMTTINHMTDNHYVDGITSINANVSQQQYVVKFEMQLYKTSDVEYLLDLQRLSGPVLLFLDFCAFFMMRLDVL